MRKYLGDVVQELTVFGVIGRVPIVARMLCRPIANDFRWYAAHRHRLPSPSPFPPTAVAIFTLRRLCAPIIGIITIYRQLTSSLICA